MDFGETILKAGLSAGVGGGLVGGLGALARGRPTRSAVLRAMMGSAAMAGGIGTGSTAIGLGVMGKPSKDDPTGYTRRGAVGGGVGGSAAGATLGALVGKGELPIPKSTPLWLSEYANKLKKMKGAPAIGATIGGLGLGAISAYLGANEGMQLDALENELRARKYG